MLIDEIVTLIDATLLDVGIDHLHMGSACGCPNEIREPDNSTVDDWFGQNVARDQELADDLVDAGGRRRGGRREALRAARPQGKQKYQEGHRRP